MGVCIGEMRTCWGLNLHLGRFIINAESVVNRQFFRGQFNLSIYVCGLFRYVPLSLITCDWSLLCLLRYAGYETGLAVVPRIS